MDGRSKMTALVVTTQVAIGIGVGTVLVTILGAYILKKIRRENIPTEWETIGNVKELFIFPLKSGKGIKAQNLLLTEKGVKEFGKTDNNLELRDRSFVIYTTKSKEVRTARQLPKSVLIGIQAAENGVILSAPNKIDLYVKVPEVKNNVAVNAVWGSLFGNETFICTDCGDSVAKWLSNFLLDQEDGLRLGYGDGSTARNVLRDHKNWAKVYTNMDNDMAGIFSDLAALHLVNNATIDNLNEKLSDDQKVTFMNFRPNLLIEGPNAFAEDDWQYVKIGEVIAKVCLECLRCIETTVSQNGVMSKQREPLKTLEAYRSSKTPFKKGVMGTYLKILKTGIIKQGDPVSIPKSLQ